MMAAIYETATGDIVRVRAYADAAELASFIAVIPVGYAYLTSTDNIDVDEQYAPGGVLTDRVELEGGEYSIIADGGATADGKVEFAMPSGTVVYSHFHRTETTSGAENFTFQSLRMGVYVFDFTPPMSYVPVRVEITVDAV